MKIVMFSDSYRPYLSGVVRSIETFAGELRSLGHKVFVFGPSYGGDHLEENVFRFPSVPAPTRKDFHLALPFSRQLYKVFHGLAADVVHLHSPFLLGGVGAKWARRQGLPVVFTNHTLYDAYIRYIPIVPNFISSFATGFTTRFSNACDLVVAPTEVVKKRLLNQGVDTIIRTVPTGVVLEEFVRPDRGWIRQQYGIPAEKRILLCVARFGGEKNLDFLLRTFRLINLELPETHLLLVGIGPLEKKLNTLASSLGLANRVTIVGQELSRQEIANCYCGSDLFLFASVTETQGIIVSEAHAAGKPVVAVGANGIGEMVHDGFDGLLTAEKEGELAARAIQVLRDQVLYNQLAQGALETAGQVSSRRTTMALLEAYQEAIASRQSSSDWGKARSTSPGA